MGWRRVDDPDAMLLWGSHARKVKGLRARGDYCSSMQLVASGRSRHQGPLQSPPSARIWGKRLGESAPNAPFFSQPHYICQLHRSGKSQSRCERGRGMRGGSEVSLNSVSRRCIIVPTFGRMMGGIQGKGKAERLVTLNSPRSG